MRRVSAYANDAGQGRALYPEFEVSVPADAIEVAGIDPQHHQVLVGGAMTALDGCCGSDGATKGADQCANAAKGLAGVHLFILFCAASSFLVQRNKYR